MLFSFSFRSTLMSFHTKKSILKNKKIGGYEIMINYSPEPEPGPPKIGRLRNSALANLLRN